MAKAVLNMLLKNGTSANMSVNAELGKRVSEYLAGSKQHHLYLKDEQGNLVFLGLSEVVALTITFYE